MVSRNIKIMTVYVVSTSKLCWISCHAFSVRALLSRCVQTSVKENTEATARAAEEKRKESLMQEQLQRKYELQQQKEQEALAAASASAQSETGKAPTAAAAAPKTPQQPTKTELKQKKKAEKRERERQKKEERKRKEEEKKARKLQKKGMRGELSVGEDGFLHLDEQPYDVPGNLQSPTLHEPAPENSPAAVTLSSGNLVADRLSQKTRQPQQATAISRALSGEANAGGATKQADSSHPVSLQKSEESQNTQNCQFSSERNSTASVDANQTTGNKSEVASVAEDGDELYLIPGQEGSHKATLDPEEAVSDDLYLVPGEAAKVETTAEEEMYLMPEESAKGGAAAEEELYLMPKEASAQPDAQAEDMYLMPEEATPSGSIQPPTSPAPAEAVTDGGKQAEEEDAGDLYLMPEEASKTVTEPESVSVQDDEVELYLMPTESARSSAVPQASEDLYLMPEEGAANIHEAMASDDFVMPTVEPPPPLDESMSVSSGSRPVSVSLSEPGNAQEQAAEHVYTNDPKAASPSSADLEIIYEEGADDSVSLSSGDHASSDHQPGKSVPKKNPLLTRESTATLYEDMPSEPTSPRAQDQVAGDTYEAIPGHNNPPPPISSPSKAQGREGARLSAAISMHSAPPALPPRPLSGVPPSLPPRTIPAVAPGAAVPGQDWHYKNVDPRPQSRPTGAEAEEQGFYEDLPEEGAISGQVPVTAASSAVSAAADAGDMYEDLEQSKAAVMSYSDYADVQLDTSASTAQPDCYEDMQPNLMTSSDVKRGQAKMSQVSSETYMDMAGQAAETTSSLVVDTIYEGCE